MEKIIISAESCCDLDEKTIKENNISIIDMAFYVDEVEYRSTKQLSAEDFYTKMKNNSKTSTSQLNAFEGTEYFEKLLKQNKAIVHISLSSGISGTYNSMASAAKELNESGKYKNKVYVVDSLGACGGIGLLTLLACEFAKNNSSDAQKVYEHIEKQKHDICHIFTVSDLKYLLRGGRVSKTSYVLGSALNIKPVMKVTKDGKLVAYKKVFGRKKAIQTLVDDTAANFSAESKTILINHANCLEEAQSLKAKIDEKLGTDALVLDLGFVIGAHSGPETLAVFCVGKKD